MAVPRRFVAPAALTLLHVVLAVMVFHPAPFTGGDDATYISLANSLLHGSGYTDIWDPALPRHTQYPPVFALVVAAGLMAGLSTAVGLKFMMIAITALAVLASVVWLRKVTTAGTALCAGFFIAISPEILRLGREVLSDAPFWLFATLALIAWYHAAGRARNQTAATHAALETKWVVAATVLTLAAYFTRSAGVPLLLAVVIWLSIRRDWHAVAIVVGMSAPLILGWWAFGGSHGGGGYLAPFLAVDPYDPSKGTLGWVDLFDRITANIGRYTQRHVPRLVTGRPISPLPLGLALLAAIAYGWAKRIRRPSLAEVWLPLYLALLVAWPVQWSGARFLLPIVPLLALYAAEAVKDIANQTSYPWAVAGIVVFAGWFAARPHLLMDVTRGMVCRKEYELGKQYPCTEVPYAEFFSLAAATKGRLPANAVVLSRKPSLFFMYSGYRSRLYPLTAEPDSLFALADRTGARFVVIDRISDTSTRYLYRILEERPQDFCVVTDFSQGMTVLMLIAHGGAPRPPNVNPDVYRRCMPGEWIGAGP